MNNEHSPVLKVIKQVQHEWLKEYERQVGLQMNALFNVTVNLLFDGNICWLSSAT